MIQPGAGCKTIYDDMESQKELELKLREIKAFAFDIDGVLTDGSLLAMPDGDILRMFNTKDGFGIRTATENGYPVAIITGGCSESIIHRAHSYGIEEADLYMLSKDKVKDFELFCERHGLKSEQVAYVGDDIPDIPVIKAAGLGVCPCDAVEEVLEVADFISSRPGGKGCARDLIERVLKPAGKWIFDPSRPWAGSFPEKIVEFAGKTGRNLNNKPVTK